MVVKSDSSLCVYDVLSSSRCEGAMNLVHGVYFAVEYLVVDGFSNENYSSSPCLNTPRASLLTKWVLLFFRKKGMKHWASIWLFTVDKIITTYTQLSKCNIRDTATSQSQWFMVSKYGSRATSGMIWIEVELIRKLSW